MVSEKVKVIRKELGVIEFADSCGVSSVTSDRNSPARMGLFTVGEYYRIEYHPITEQDFNTNNHGYSQVND